MTRTAFRAFRCVWSRLMKYLTFGSLTTTMCASNKTQRASQNCTTQRQDLVPRHRVALIYGSRATGPHSITWPRVLLRQQRACMKPVVKPDWLAFCTVPVSEALERLHHGPSWHRSPHSMFAREHDQQKTRLPQWTHGTQAQTALESLQFSLDEGAFLANYINERHPSRTPYI